MLSQKEVDWQSTNFHSVWNDSRVLILPSNRPQGKSVKSRFTRKLKIHFSQEISPHFYPAYSLPTLECTKLFSRVLSLSGRTLGNREMVRSGGDETLRALGGPREAQLADTVFEKAQPLWLWCGPRPPQRSAPDAAWSQPGPRPPQRSAPDPAWSQPGVRIAFFSLFTVFVSLSQRASTPE